MMIDCEVDLGILGYRPAGDLAPVHSQDHLWAVHTRSDLVQGDNTPPVPH